VALRERLTGRGQDDETIIARRMQDAETEMSHYNEFDYVVVNDNFDTAVTDLQAVISSQRLKIERQRVGLQHLLVEFIGQFIE